MKVEQFVTLSFLLFAFPLAFSRQVIDSSGNPVLASGKYYILPAISAGTSGGGLRPIERDSSSKCPVIVFQDLSRIKRDMPLKFTMLGESDGIISTDSPLEIAFEDMPSCATSSKWVVVGDDFPLKWIGIGTAKDHAGKKVINGSFRIQKKYMMGYQLVFCPTDATTCSDIARTQDQLGYRLVLTNSRHEATPIPFHVYDVAFIPFGV